MVLHTLKQLRIVVPGFIILLAAATLGVFTGLWKIELPKTWAEAQKLLVVVILGAVYYVLPIRESANRRYFETVNDHLRAGLVRISGFPDEPDVFSWKALRALFYSTIDSDKSLSAKAELAYHNGLFWTTAADIRGIAVIFSIVSLILHIAKIDGSLTSAEIFCLASLVSIFATKTLTKRHVEIGEQQLEIFETKYKNEVTKYIGGLKNRPSP